MENTIKFSFYPNEEILAGKTKSLYYVEFRTERNNHKYWTLFKRQYLKGSEHSFNPSGEVHPFNLGGGRVDDPFIISMNTEGFLKKMVDSLNKYETN